MENYQFDKNHNKYNPVSRMGKKMKGMVAGLCVVMVCATLLYPSEVWAVDSAETGTFITDDQSELGQNLKDPGTKKPDSVDGENETNQQGEAGQGETDQGTEAQKEGQQTPQGEGQQTSQSDENVQNIRKQRSVAQNNQDDSQWNIIKREELNLQYDDRYTLSELEGIEGGWAIAQIKTESVTSYQVSAGKKTDTRDSDVVIQGSSDKMDITAVGVGQAKILLVKKENLEAAKAILEGTAENVGTDEKIEAVQVMVTVKPAALTLMYIAGQSNAEGWCSSNTGYQRSASVANAEGEVYSTYAPSNSKAKSITGLSFPSYCTKSNASDFVAGALTGNTSISGKKLVYALDTLTEGNNGKTGPDGGLAYEWNSLTGDKVWAVNTAWGATSISSWVPGGTCYEQSLAVNRLVQQTYQAEIEAGHYTKGSQLLFWLQGEKDKEMTAESYYDSFKTMYSGLESNLNLDGLGIISVRSDEGNRTNAEDISMSGPRIAQYAAGNGKEMAKAFVVSNANEQWVSDAKVKSYFSGAYPQGSFSYPMQGGSVKVPSSVSEVHSDIHYSQIAHNENGITAAKGMYAALQKQSGLSKVTWTDRNGKPMSGLTTDRGDEEVAVPVCDPSYAGKGLTYKVAGTAVSYRENTGTIVAEEKGSATVSVCDSQGKVLSSLEVTVTDIGDLTGVAGTNYNGLFRYNGTWWYLKGGRVQKNYTGVVKNENGWWYVENGKVDFTYNGFAKNSNGWWYIEDGKVTFHKNDVIKGVVEGENAWWYVVDSKVTFTDTVAKNKNGWWRIENGKVNFDSNTVAKNSKGWWVIQSGKVNFSYNGFAKNSNGWWYCKGGKVQFGVNDVIKGTVNGQNAWWHVVDGEVAFDTTIAKNKNGWWHIQNGKVNFNSNTVAKNSKGWWVIQSGKVNFSYNGFAKNSNGWWYCKGGKVQFGVNDVIKGKVNSQNAWWHVVDGEVAFDTTVAKNKNGWWHIQNGKVNFSSNTVAKNSKGWWVIRSGKVNFGYNGFAENSNGWWYCKGGKVQFKVNDVIKGKVNGQNGWWHVVGGEVTFDTTVAKNTNGWWYIKDGKVDFGYSGQYKDAAHTYTIKDGKVVRTA